MSAAAADPALFFLFSASWAQTWKSIIVQLNAEEKNNSLSPSQSHLWWKLAPRFSFRSLPIVRCWRNGAYRMEIMAQNDSSFFLPSLTLSWSLIALSHRPKVRAPDFSFLIFSSPFWWFHDFAFVVGWFCFFLLPSQKKTAAATTTTTAFYIFVGVLLLLQRTKSIQVHKGGRTTTTKKMTRERGAGFSPFWIGLDQTHMLWTMLHLYRLWNWVETRKVVLAFTTIRVLNRCQQLSRVWWKHKSDMFTLSSQKKHFSPYRKKQRVPQEVPSLFLSIESKVVHLKWRGDKKKKIKGIFSQVEKGAVGVLFSIIILSLLLSLQVNCAVWVGRAVCGVAFLDNFFFFLCWRNAKKF